MEPGDGLKFTGAAARAGAYEGPLYAAGPGEGPGEGAGAGPGVSSLDDGGDFFFLPITPPAYRDPTIMEASAHKIKTNMATFFPFVSSIFYKFIEKSSTTLETKPVILTHRTIVEVWTVIIVVARSI